MTVYSHSRLNTYQNCPLKFKFQYITKPEIEKKDSVEAFMGSRCHESLEKLYKLLLNSRLLTKKELLDDYKQRWDEKWHDDIYIVRKDLNQQNYFDQGQKSLSEYYDHYHPFDRDKTISIEQKVMVDLNGDGKYRLQGFIDRLSEEGEGHYKIHDYKTERKFKEQKDFVSDRQLALYQIGISEMYADVKSVELIWHYLIFDKEARSIRTPEQLTQLKQETIALIQEVEQAVAEDNLPYKESLLCDWCEYFSICPAKKHFHITEALEPEKFDLDDGVQLVNRYDDVKNAIKELGLEKALLEEKLLGYCKQLSIEVVRGSDKQVKVKFEPAYKFKYSLTGNPEEEERLIQFLKERGIYDKFVALNYSKLNSQMKKKELSDEIKSLLKEHLVLIAGAPRFNLSKIKKSEF